MKRLASCVHVFLRLQNHPVRGGNFHPCCFTFRYRRLIQNMKPFEHIAVLHVMVSDGYSRTNVPGSVCSLTLITPWQLVAPRSPSSGACSQLTLDRVCNTFTFAFAELHCDHVAGRPSCTKTTTMMCAALMTDEFPLEVFVRSIE